MASMTSRKWISSSSRPARYTRRWTRTPLRIFRRALHARIWSSGRTQAILIACSCAPTHAVRMSIWTLSPAPDGTSSWSFARRKQKRKSRCPKQSASQWRNGTRRAKHAGLCMTALHRRICPVMTAAATCGFARKRTTPSGTISACKAERGFRAPAKQADRMNCRWRWMFPRARRRSNLRV